MTSIRLKKVSHQGIPLARGGWISQQKTLRANKIFQMLSEVEATETQIICIKEDWQQKTTW